MNLELEMMPIKLDGLFALILGPSGAGKSFVMGTYPGKTLMLYGSSESHGTASAAKTNKSIIPIAWDKTKDTAGLIIEVPPEKLMKRLKDLLDPQMLTKAGVKCVAIDSLTALTLDLKNTPQFKQRCADPKTGKHVAFRESEALIELLAVIIRDLQTLNDVHKIDIVVSSDLQIQTVSEDGTFLEAKPSLATFGVARAVVQAFPDVLILGRIGEKRTPVFQCFAKAAASSVDRETKTVVKYLEFNPRLRGVAEMPEIIEADLKALLKLKGG